MSLLHLPLLQINESHLLALVDSGVAESRTIDYKRSTYGAANSDYSEFLADVSSFANTSGGDLVLGIDAVNGIPTALTPLTTPMEPEVLRLQQVARGGLQPRLSNIEFQPIPIQTGGNVLVIRTARSYNTPHRVIRQGSNRFWSRSAAGKYEPDVNELRILFNAGPALAVRISNFCLDRVAKISAGQAPVRLMNRGCLILHVVPFSALDAPPQISLGAIEHDIGSFVPIGSRTANGARINFDGVLKTSNLDLQAAEHRAYLQVFRNGIIEAVHSTLISSSSGNPVIFNLDDLLIRETMRIFRDLAAIGVELPYSTLVSLVGVNGAQFNYSRGQTFEWPDDFGDRLDRDEYRFDEVTLEALPTTHTECATAIRPILEQIANIGGKGTSRSFDNQGHYISKR